jgi:hypothetical protein
VDNDTAGELLQELCADLRRLSAEAGGPTLRTLATRIGLGKTQVGAILNGRIRRLPDWQVVSGLVTSLVGHAQARARTAKLSVPTGLEEYWLPRYALLEYAFAQAAARGTLPNSEPTSGSGSIDSRPAPESLPTPTTDVPRRNASRRYLRTFRASTKCAGGRTGCRIATAQVHSIYHRVNYPL